MPSALSNQLAVSASLNSSLLLDHTRKKKQTASYLFSGREVDAHDLDSIHAIASNAFTHLRTISPSISSKIIDVGTEGTSVTVDFEQSLFSDSARVMDRTMQSKDVTLLLDRTLGVFLRLLGPCLLQAPTGKVLEWLVKRFRINEFNVDDILALFLPYHDSLHFVKMLSILDIKPDSMFAFLLPVKATSRPLPRSVLVKNMVANTDLARYVASLLPDAMKDVHSHRALLSFNTAVMHDYLASQARLEEGTLAFVLPALLGPIQAVYDDLNTTLGSYILLSTLAHRVSLAPPAVAAIVTTMANAAALRGKQSASIHGQVPAIHFVKSAVVICSTQDGTISFPASTGNLCLKIPGFVDEIRNAFQYLGAENFIYPLLDCLKPRVKEPPVSAVYAAVVNTPGVSMALIKQVSALLIRIVVSEDTNHDSSARALLALVHQRHFELLRKVAGIVLEETADVSEEDNSRKTRKKKLDDLLLSFSSVHPWAQNADVNDIVVASTSSSKEIRVKAVEQLFSILRQAEDGSAKLESSDMVSVRSALFARLYDTHPGVLHALYESPKLYLTTVALNSTPSQVLDTIIAQLTPVAPSRSILRAHIAFLVGPFSLAYPNLNGAIQAKVVFPFALASKAKFRTTVGVWEAVKEQNGLLDGWMKGCVDIWDDTGLFEAADKEIDDVNAEKICTANLSVAAKIAENILASNDCSADITLVLEMLNSPLAHGRALAYLVVRAFLLRSSGNQQISLASDALHSMRLGNMGILDGLADQNIGMQEVLSDESICMKATLKPGGRTTVQVLQASILALIPALKRPNNSHLNWVANLNIEDNPEVKSLSKGTPYVTLMCEIYSLAASSRASAPSSLATSLLQALFLSLKDESLVFLIGLLASHFSSVEQVRTHALLHTLAFLRSHNATNAVDFQVVLPSLLAVLMDTRTNKQGRALTFECLAMLTVEGDKKHIYGLDTIYGASSANLQYLDAKDLVVYIKSLLDHRAQLVQDASYIKVFHHQHLMNTNAKYRRRILCFILSHVIGHPSPDVKIALLQSIEDVSDSSKPHMLLSQVEELTHKSAEIDLRFGSLFEKYGALIITAFVAMPSIDLNEEKENTIWPVFIAALRTYFQSNSMTAAQIILGEALQKTIFVSLSTERRAEICITLLQLGTLGGDAYVASRKLLSSLLLDLPLIFHLLAHYQPMSPGSDAPASKRARVEGAPSDDTTNDTAASLIMLAEILASKDLPGSHDLISRLLDTLSKVTHQESSTAVDTSYVSQMLMSAVEKAAEKVHEAPARAIRLDILVEIMRMSNNPQTFHQALILMATLARITPESVLHNIMPVFTFMGSNVFHRDDSYSFKVVQKTIENIVPVMVSSLRDKHANGLGLYVAARDFLRIFTDASNHIPRHRRSNFFVHLINILGPQDFLAPICMLLVDKVANRVSRQSAEEAQTQLTLPLSVIRQFSIPLQLFVLTEVLRESQRLISRVMDPESAGTAFLDFPRDEEHSSSTSSTFKRRAQGLIIFAGYAMQPLGQASEPSTNGTITDLIALLINLVMTESESAHTTGVADIIATTQISVTKIMEVIWARDFLKAILMMLRSDDSKLQSGALHLLAGRIAGIVDAVRRDSITTTKQIIESIGDIIARQSAGELVESALNALRSLGTSVCSGEEAPLAATIPSILKIMQARTSAASALSVLPCYISSLGPRIIPHFRNIVQECLSVLRENIKGKWQESTAVHDALKILHGLLLSLPSFYGELELTQLITLYLEYCATESQDNTLLALLKAVAKRVPSKVLLPAMYDLWPSISKAPENTNVSPLTGYFSLFERCLRAAPRSEVFEHLRSIFHVFIEGFDIDTIPDGDPAVISAFVELVVQLNENAFKPLFRKLFDWAFASEIGYKNRKITFLRVYMALLDYFKGLMNPYMSLVLQPLCDTLNLFASSSDNVLWTCTVATLTKSFENDDGTFWRDDKLQLVVTPLIAQVSNCIKHNIPEGKGHLDRCLTSLTGAVNDDALLKTINLNILMHTRSEDARERIYALACSKAIWNEHGGKLIGFVAETATFISECAEDENDNVVREAHNLKHAVERVAGSINGL
ncbi:hypothetical protein BJ138DRAFT_1128268 [Hygrophoropsis aurantiaca]|uniref:Uncharacterized protein n=1 Tax=Hygrophoropsis aurantiaca TaxID=72124 RepID=A0ACB8A630_9AGAM|nr:hypothetical protein BJ138DRAFT_1128268 [Hygrophoropsis aurantiaca]